MHELTDAAFDRLITRAMNELPQHYIKGLNNVVIVMADAPTPAQAQRMKLDAQHLLLGLFEGVPLTQQGSGWSGMLPGKITLFKYPLLAVATSEADLFAHIKRTLWHEIAHFYGLSHADMDKRQARL